MSRFGDSGFGLEIRVGCGVGAPKRLRIAAKPRKTVKEMHYATYFWGSGTYSSVSFPTTNFPD